jgi:DNA-binding transcriptional ArsR family regulator
MLRDAASVHPLQALRPSLALLELPRARRLRLRIFRTAVVRLQHIDASVAVIPWQEHHGAIFEWLHNALDDLLRHVRQTRHVSVQIAPPDFDRMFGALADHTRRDIVRRAINADEGVVELASHYPMSFAAVQKHVAVLERAGLVTKERIGRRKVVRTNLERLRVVRRLLDQYEELWRGRIDRMAELISHLRETDR